MPVDPEIALAQVERFANWKDYPLSESGLQDLIDAFAEVARDEEHCKQLGDRLVRTLKFCPKPAHVYELAEELIEHESAERDWKPQKLPGDEPFGGVGDLIDERVKEILEARIKSQKSTHAEKAAARKMLEMERLRSPRQAPAAKEAV